MRVHAWVVVLLLVVARGAHAAPADNDTPPIAPVPAPEATPAPESKATGSLPPVATEQPSAPPACVPDCRAGFMCRAGACVSACNPPCPTTHECVEGGRCVAPDASALKQAVKDAVREYYDAKQAEYRAKSVRRHDGLYVRLGFNAGYAWDAAERGDSRMTSKGAGGFLEYAFGGNLSDHFIVAFAHHTFGVFSPETSVDGTHVEFDHTAFYQVIGLLIDVYPDPTDGWHITATLGSSSANVQLRDGENTDNGFGLLLGGGYDFWIGEQWSLGVGGRLIYISGASDDFGDHRAIIPTLTFSALWH